jgi:hypothetical protein
MAIYKRNIKQASKEAAASTGNKLTKEEELQALLRMCSPEDELNQKYKNYPR